MKMGRPLKILVVVYVKCDSLTVVWRYADHPLANIGPFHRTLVRPSKWSILTISTYSHNVFNKPTSRRFVLLTKRIEQTIN